MTAHRISLSQIAEQQGDTVNEQQGWVDEIAN